MRIKEMKFRTKVAVGATLVAASIAGGGVAFAYFTSSTGTATGTGSVGSATGWNVTDGGTLNSAALFPGSGTDSDTASVANADAGNQYLTTITATLNTPAACPAGSFSLVTSTGWVIAGGGQSATYAAGVDVRGTGSTTGTVGPVVSSALSMVMNDLSSNQNACSLAANAPTIVWTVS